MPALNPVDWIFLAVLLLSVVVGVWRGLVFEVLSLLGWVVAYVAAQWFSPSVAPYIAVGTPGGGLNLAVSFALTFLAVLIVWALASRLVRMLVGASPLSGLDRLLGALFGLLRGALLLLAVATVVLMTPARSSALWASSHGATWTSALLIELKPLLPDTIAQHLPV